MRYSNTLFSFGIALALVSTTAAYAQTFSTKPFTDVPEGHAHYEAVEFLRTNNVLKGYGDGTYRPDARINRAEFVKLITNPFILDTERLNDCLTEELDEDDTTVFFPDVRRDSWYAPEVCHAKIKNLISGYPDGRFRPGNQVIFVEAAKMLSSTFSLQATTDETDEQWYRKYVERLDDKNAIPTSVEGFASVITRGEMAEMLYRLKTNKTDGSSKTYGQLK